MMFFKKKHIVRRYSNEPTIAYGYSSSSYTDMKMMMDVQTPEAMARIDPGGTELVQKLKVFCDDEVFTENEEIGQKADRLWFQGKWFSCRSSRLSENTPLRHWTATFVVCLDQEPPPNEVM